MLDIFAVLILDIYVFIVVIHVTFLCLHTKSKFRKRNFKTSIM